MDPAVKVTKSLYEANDEFPFQDLLLNKPISVLGEPNNFMIKVHLGNKNSPVYIQTPPCLLKDGTLTKSGKHTVIDFIFSNENSEFLVWLEKLEDNCQKVLLDKQSDWFDSQLTADDIETLFITPYKTIKGKGGKMYSVRTNLPITKKIKIFNEDKEEVEFQEPFHTEEKVIAIFEIVGVKCSPRNFHIDLEVKQMMLLKENPLLTSCMISTSPPIVPPDVPEESSVPPVIPPVVPPVVPEESLQDELLPLDFLDITDESEGKEWALKSRDDIFLQNVVEKVKTARHLGIMTFLQSRNIQFTEDKLIWQ